eukprot:TRINITY_DN1982_c0_g1_i1.p1 TRINITY_DN1982_c0_g1~~TRINITY_DN1982_c0_g1_i1.p1  ORF type:complete len:295 (-),score=65.69 TRINITY_DN1982_c0_g1_i1:29-913(-)
MEKWDHKEIFREEVSAEDVPDYYDYVKIPMAFSTIKKKLENYTSMDEFQEDIRQMVENALVYNRPETVYYHEARKIEWMSEKMIAKYHKGIPNQVVPYCDGCEKEDSSRMSRMVNCLGCRGCYHFSCLGVGRIDKDLFFCNDCDISKFCQACKNATDDDHMLLCDACNAGYHIYCLKPKMDEIPHGEWYCQRCDPLLRCPICNLNQKKKMIACSNCEQNYHTNCLGRTPKVLKTWLCDECQKEKEEEEDGDSEEISDAEEDSTDTPPSTRRESKRESSSSSSEDDDVVLKKNSL